MIPFFVADRPISLRILRGVDLARYEGPLGIMTHANTSRNFRQVLRDFPCGEHFHKGACDARCAQLKRRVVKICDSGVFTKKGCMLSYPDLFSIYEEMGVDYGIIIDHLGDKDATLRSARAAMKVYKAGDYKFRLIGVAQGKTTKEYLACYKALKKAGFEHVAVGGLLRKRANTSHYVHVRGEALFTTLSAIREKYPTDWLFALGCYHPTRHLRFSELGLFGSDYKGWIFNYDAKNERGVQGARRSRFRQVRRFLTSEVFDTPLYLNGERREIAAARRRNDTLVIVGCGRKKIWSERPKKGATTAQKAYVGSFFQRNRSYAKRFGKDWAILSAKHGLLSPRSLIPEDYDQTFRARNEEITTRDLRAQILEKGYHKYARVVVLGGREYGHAIREAYAGMGIPVELPFEGITSIGLMTQAVARALATGKPLRNRG